jgi:nitrite reductase/ring-hydroxylating ferredoxin subunit
MSSKFTSEKAHILCPLNELRDGASRGFSLPGEAPGQSLELFVVRRGSAVYAYRNRCPHTGAPLDWQPDQFLDEHGELIQCALHGALFAVESGLCLRGPCVGKSLQSLSLRISDDGLVTLTENTENRGQMAPTE